jgi:uncharacterized protein (DUF2384 family)
MWVEAYTGDRKIMQEMTREHVTAQYKLIDKARAIFGDAKASKWLSTTNKSLGGKKPLDVPIKAATLLRELESIQDRHRIGMLKK